MTQEQKAMAYDEAIKRAKEINNEKKAQPFDVMLKVFPELKESEDEKIRKWLIDYLWKEKIFLQEAHSSVENNPKYRCVMDAIAWLEKQGRVKESQISQHENKMCKENDDSLTSEDKQIMKEIAEFIYNSAFKPKDIKKKEKWLTWLEKQGEQKPVWSERDEKMFRSLHNLIYVVRDCDCNSSEKKELSDWLESLKDRVQPQPKQEWGKEDEKYIRLSTDIINSALRAGFCVQLDRDRCVDWLKSLKERIGE